MCFSYDLAIGLICICQKYFSFVPLPTVLQLDTSDKSHDILRGGGLLILIRTHHEHTKANTLQQYFSDEANFVLIPTLHRSNANPRYHGKHRRGGARVVFGEEKTSAKDGPSN